MPFLQGEVDELLARCHRRRHILARGRCHPLVFGAPSRTSRILHNRDRTHLLEYLVTRISGEGLCLTASSKFKKTRTSPCRPG